MARNAVPGDWGDALVRSVMVWAVAFVAFNLKEFTETQSLDPAQVVVDATWVGGGFLIVNALLMLMMPKAR